MIVSNHMTNSMARSNNWIGNINRLNNYRFSELLFLQTLYFSSVLEHYTYLIFFSLIHVHHHFKFFFFVYFFPLLVFFIDPYSIK